MPSGESRGSVAAAALADTLPAVSPADRLIFALVDALGGEVLYTVHHHRCDHWDEFKVRRIQMLNPIKMRTRNFSLPGGFCDVPDVQRYPIGWRCAEHAPRSQERYAA